MFKEVIYKELLSTASVGIILDTREWALGINWTFGYDSSPRKQYAGSLLQVSILCLHLLISLP